MINLLSGRKGPIFSLLLVALLVQTEAKHCRAPKGHWKNFDDPIVGRHGKVSSGFNVDPADFPSFATLKSVHANSSIYACGGVVLSKRTILTAAHCVTGSDVKRVWVHPGIKGQANWDSEHTYFGSKFCVSNDYKPAGVPKFDYAVVRLHRELKVETPAIGYANWPERELVPTDIAYIIGTGHTHKKGHEADQAIALPVKVTACDSGNNHKSLMCLEPQTKEFVGEPCVGDSGGPVYAVIDGKLELFGLVSRVSSECRKEGAEKSVVVNVFNQKDNILKLAKDCE